MEQEYLIKWAFFFIGLFAALLVVVIRQLIKNQQRLQKSVAYLNELEIDRYQYFDEMVKFFDEKCETDKSGITIHEADVPKSELDKLGKYIAENY